MTITGDISRFNEAASKFVSVLNINAATVVKKESGELLKTLVRITPPTQLARSRKALRKRIFASFEAASEAGDKAEGNSMWYHATPQFLFGVAPERDLRKAGINTIRQVYLTLSRSSGAQHIPFRNPRKEQQVRLAQNLVITKGQQRRLGVLLQKSFGRLKAGWLGGWDALQPSGSNMPPGYVMQHKPGCHGRYVDGLGVKNYPKFSLINYAVGIGAPGVIGIIKSALAIRSKAMAMNFALIMKGKKNLADYAK